MIYSKNEKSKEIDSSLFQNPTSEYRAAPFWAWNCKLDKEVLKRQIRYLKEMGFGGFFMHSRIGMATPYLGDEFMDVVSECVEKAKEEDMLAYLYDEDRWPSGFAGGFVTKNIRYRSKALFMTRQNPEGCVSREEALKNGYRYFVAAFDVKTNEKGELLDYRRIERDTDARYSKWYAYVEIGGEDPWYNDTFYVDTMDKEAIRCFIATTYEVYKNKVGKDFGGVVPAIFSDEPQCGASQFCIKNGAKNNLDFANAEHPVAITWSTYFEEEFIRLCGYNIVDFLPELILNKENNVASKVRYDYYDCVSELFAEAYADQLGKWCAENDIAFTGHLLGEDVLWGQISRLGETMRSYRSFTIPGIDVLCDKVLLNCAKQVQSMAHQRGINAVLSELYGVTGWDFDFRDHKFQGDWQAALGITLRVPHLSWVSMEGEGKRDYPASLNYQSSWYKEYKNVENHFARLNTALTRGKPVVRLAVIHPVESGWLVQGPTDVDAPKLKNLEQRFHELTDWLLGNQIDFNFICESQLPSQCKNSGYPLRVGEMSYDAVLIANCETIRGTTVERLAKFCKEGGKLIFAGKCPAYVDAGDNSSVAELYKDAVQADYSKIDILAALEDIRILKIQNSDGNAAENLIYNLRQDNTCRWLFVARKDKVTNKKVVPPQNIIITINGEYTPVLYDTISGKTEEIPFKLKSGRTVIEYALDIHSSLLLCLREKTVEFKAGKTENTRVLKRIDIKDTVAYELNEPNVLLLDRAELSINGGEFMPEEEVLKAENRARELLGLRPRGELTVQPWVYAGSNLQKHRLTLRYTINSDIEVEKPVLAVENAEMLSIELNGKTAENRITGYYVDEAIKTVELPPIHKGKNILLIDMPFGETANVEWCYILGNFGVRVEGCIATIEEPRSKIGFSSITNQGMPFYGADVTYKMKIDTPAGHLKIKVSDYVGAIINVRVDGNECGKIMLAPYTVEVKDISKGEHTVELTLFGHRGNSFGTIHLNNPSFTWYSSEAWRKDGEEWCYEYHLKDIGILKSPVFEMSEKY